MKAEQDAIPHGDPIALFAAWFEDARQSEPNDSNAMALATATPGGLPSVRMVLLKGHGPDGFVFYTNALSRKGQEIAANPHAALLFHWKSLRRQIRIEGPLHEVSPEQADAYFASRHRDSQLGAVASDQSAPLDSRATFVARYEAAETAGLPLSMAKRLIGATPEELAADAAQLAQTLAAQPSGTPRADPSQGAGNTGSGRTTSVAEAMAELKASREKK